MNVEERRMKKEGRKREDEDERRQMEMRGKETGEETRLLPLNVSGSKEGRTLEGHMRPP